MYFVMNNKDFKDLIFSLSQLFTCRKRKQISGDKSGEQFLKLKHSNVSNYFCNKKVSLIII